MMSSAGVAIAAITVMLWILWSDTIRTHRPTPFLYGLRVVLYLGLASVMVVNMVRYPRMYSGTSRGLAFLAIAVAIVGAGYFVRKLAAKRA